MRRLRPLCRSRAFDLFPHLLHTCLYGFRYSVDIGIIRRFSRLRQILHDLPVRFRAVGTQCDRALGPSLCPPFPDTLLIRRDSLITRSRDGQVEQNVSNCATAHWYRPAGLHALPCRGEPCAVSVGGVRQVPYVGFLVPVVHAPLPVRHSSQFRRVRYRGRNRESGSDRLEPSARPFGATERVGTPLVNELACLQASALTAH